MEPTTHLFLSIGGLFMAGLAADMAARWLRLPRVTLLLVIGVALGQSGTGLIQTDMTALFDPLSTLALTLVAFLLGNALTRENLAAHGRAILILSWSIVLVTLAVMTLGLVLAGLATGLALILAAIACATAPAATLDTLRQSGTTGAFADTLHGIVAVDDAWGLIVFSLVLVAAGPTAANGGAEAALTHAALDLGGAALIGAGVGAVGVVLTGRLSPGEPLQTEALGLVFLTAGLASWLGVSVLLSGLVAGAVIANFARHHERAFHEMETLQWPFMLLFFVMAGAVLDLAQVALLGGVGALFIGLRTAARLLGGWIGGWASGMSPVERRWIGPALLPQAGVAVGMALVAGDHFPHWRDTILAITVGTTIIFELIGPPVTLLALERVSKAAASPEPDQNTAPGSRKP